MGRTIARMEDMANAYKILVGKLLLRDQPE